MSQQYQNAVVQFDGRGRDSDALDRYEGALAILDSGFVDCKDINTVVPSDRIDLIRYSVR